MTNLGDLGVETVFGVIHPPQVALVGFGASRRGPWPRTACSACAPCVTATLAADHRVSDGQRGARFLAELERLLQDGGRMTRDEIRAAVLAALGDVAPEADLGALDPTRAAARRSSRSTRWTSSTS